MFRSIVVGHDGTPGADAALALARALREPSGGRIVVAAVLAGRAGPAPPEPLHAGDVDVELLAGAPAEQLVRFAERSGADLIVLGPTHHGTAGVLTARTTVQGITHGAPCAVAVARAGARRDIGRICVAYEATPEARVALARAYDLALSLDATVDVTCVAPVVVGPYAWGAALALSGLSDAAERQAQEELDEALALAPSGVGCAGHVLIGAPVPRLLDHAAGADLLIAGSRRQGRFKRALAGSTSMALLTRAPLPVLVTPRPGAPGGDAAALTSTTAA